MLCINDASDMVAILNSFIMKETTEQKRLIRKNVCQEFSKQDKNVHTIYNGVFFTLYAAAPLASSNIPPLISSRLQWHVLQTFFACKLT